MSYSLFVGDLPYDCSDDKLLQIFLEKFKSVQRVTIIRNEDGASRGFGFVRFENEIDLKSALNQEIRVDSTLLRTDIAHHDRRFNSRNRHNSYNSHHHNTNHNNHHYSNSHRGTSSATNNHTYINSKANLPGHYHQKTNNNHLSPSGSSAPLTTTAAPGPTPPATTTTAAPGPTSTSTTPPATTTTTTSHNNHAVSHTTGINKLSRPPSHLNQPMAFVDTYGMFYDASGMPINIAPFNPAVSMPGGPIPNHGDGQIEQATAMMPPPNVYYPYGPPPQAFGYPPPNAMLPHSVPQAVQQQHGPSNPSRYNPNQQAGSDINGAAGAQQPQPQQPLYYMNYWNGQPFYYDQANASGAPASIYHPTIHPFFVSSAAFLPNAQPPQTFNHQQQQQQLQQQNSEVTPNHPLLRRQPSAPHQMPYSQGGELSNTIVKNTTAPPVNIPSATTYNIESSNTNTTN